MTSFTVSSPDWDQTSTHTQAKIVYNRSGATGNTDRYGCTLALLGINAPQQAFPVSLARITYSGPDSPKSRKIQRNLEFGCYMEQEDLTSTRG